SGIGAEGQAFDGLCLFPDGHELPPCCARPRTAAGSKIAFYLLNTIKTAKTLPRAGPAAKFHGWFTNGGSKRREMRRADRNGGRAAQQFAQRGAERPLLPRGHAPAQRDRPGELRFLQPRPRLLDQAAGGFVL